MPNHLQLLLPECMCRIELETTELSVPLIFFKYQQLIKWFRLLRRSRVFHIKVWQKQSTSANEELRDGG